MQPFQHQGCQILFGDATTCQLPPRPSNWKESAQWHHQQSPQMLPCHQPNCQRHEASAKIIGGPGIVCHNQSGNKSADACLAEGQRHVRLRSQPFGASSWPRQESPFPIPSALPFCRAPEDQMPAQPTVALASGLHAHGSHAGQPQQEYIVTEPDGPSSCPDSVSNHSAFSRLAPPAAAAHACIYTETTVTR
jgi:hypothetical protein